jgi:hypothetical protein
MCKISRQKFISLEEAFIKLGISKSTLNKLKNLYSHNSNSSLSFADDKDQGLSVLKNKHAISSSYKR